VVLLSKIIIIMIIIIIITCLISFIITCKIQNVARRAGANIAVDHMYLLITLVATQFDLKKWHFIRANYTSKNGTRLSVDNNAR